MSNIGKRQLGPSQKAFKYEFTLEILKYRCLVPLPCTLKFMWKRNNKSIETKNEIAVIPGNINEFVVNEKLSSISTIIYNLEMKEFLPKESELISNMFFNGSPKKFASCHIDMRNILDPNNYRANRTEVIEISMNSHVGSSKDHRIQFRLSSIYKEEIVCSEKSLGNGSLNMSGLSIPQDTKYFEKRYEVIPSKDNKDSHSVASYNPNRYPSAKRERDDSSSIRKFDYGYLAGLKSGISNNNDLQGKSNKKSLDNRTETNEPYNNRQLAEQQQKRSKAEAELGKNKVEIEELKKKVNELVIDNMKLKEESKNSSKDEMNTFQSKLYEINNELRMARNQLDNSSQEYNRLEENYKNLKSEKLYLESQLQKRQRRIEQLQKNEVNPRVLQNIQSENSELKYQAENLRRFIEELKRLNQQKQNQFFSEKYREVQDLNSKNQSLRKQNEKLRVSASSAQEYQKRFYDLQEELKEKLKELTVNTKKMMEIEKEKEAYKNRLMQYEEEKVFMQREIIRLKQEGNDRKDGESTRLILEQKLERLQLEATKYMEQASANQQKADQKQRVLSKLEQQKTASQGKSSRLLLQINEIQKKSNDLQNENRTLREKTARLEQTNTELSENFSRLKEDSSKQMKSSTSISPEMDKMFRESLQMQVELKFANGQLIRLKNIEQNYENQRWRAEKESSQRQSLQSQFQRVEKELMNKNRALMIEVQKTKMMNQQLNEFQYNYDLLREELEKNRNIIYSGQQQVTQMEQVIHELEGIKASLEAENNQLQSEKHMLLVNNEEVRQLQAKVKELEQRNTEKLSSLEVSNKNLITAHKEIKQSQKLAEERQQILTLKEKQLYELEVKLKQIEQTKSTYDSDLSRISQEKRMLEKRMEMVMQEMHGMKKRYEEQKGRSLSVTRNEDFHKLRSMESELQKKDKNISKLTKQKLETEDENVKMNIQIMKLLSELEKYKSISSSHPSLKTITHSLK